jgi:hypothetical protein
MTRLIASICLLGATALAGCSASAQGPGGVSKPVRVKPAQSAGAQPTGGEVPAAFIEKLRAELAGQQSINPAEVKVVSAEAVTWPNGALGCPKPGEMYTQALVAGYRVELEAAGKRFVYHASEKGYFKLCPSSQAK